MINKMIVSSPKNTPNTSKGIGCEITKKQPISHYLFPDSFSF